MSNNIGIIGLGIMGGAIGANLVKAGFQVSGFDVDADRASALEKAGGKARPSVADVAAEADVVLTSLPSPAALDETVEGLKSGGRAGLIAAELSTFTIADKQRAHDALAPAGITLLDAPLSGTGHQAISGDLSAYVSGDEGAYAAAKPAFDGFCRSSHHVGPFGNGSRMKYVANLLVAIHNVSTAEGLVLGMKAGLDPKMVLDVIGDGAGASRLWNIRGPMMVNQDYDDASMSMALWQKDLNIIEAFCKEMGVEAPLYAASRKLYDQALADGRDAQDTASVCAVLEAMAGLKREP